MYFSCSVNPLDVYGSSFFLSVFRVVEKNAMCTDCGEATYFECADCFCLMNNEKEEHNCPSSPNSIKTTKPILCLPCQFQREDQI